MTFSWDNMQFCQRFDIYKQILLKIIVDPICPKYRSNLPPSGIYTSGYSQTSLPLDWNRSIHPKKVMTFAWIITPGCLILHEASQNLLLNNLRSSTAVVMIPGHQSKLVQEGLNFLDKKLSTSRFFKNVFFLLNCHTVAKLEVNTLLKLACSFQKLEDLYCWLLESYKKCSQF